MNAAATYFVRFSLVKLKFFLECGITTSYFQLGNFVLYKLWKKNVVSIFLPRDPLRSTANPCFVIDIASFQKTNHANRRLLA